MIIFGTGQDQVDLTKKFLSSRFSMKEIGEADIILGIRIKHESNDISISQSYYIEKMLKKFNNFDCTLVSTPMDINEKLRPNNGHAAPQHKYYRMIGCLKYASIVQATGMEAEWLKSLILEIPLWSKPIAHISIRCDSAATLAKAYSQI
ncbi:zinc finger, CCHC-type containing protein [Tanacetum coccineum]|uniref:Zinc finger, CCHC-type containing protein n=1 Tax=Tanacetum coccineum TaxID=301880 RepID=A0ABQ4XPB5_9ASTR